jgi:copper chaperone CopZ
VGISENTDLFSGSPSPDKGICGIFRSVPKIPRRVALDTAELAGSIALYDGNSNAVTTLSHTAHLHGAASQSAGPLPEVIRSGVMNGAELRYQDMNESKRANTPLVHTTRLSIVGMSCGACVRHMTTVLNGVTGVVHVHVDLPKNEGVVDHLLDRVNETGLIAARNEAGYQASVVVSSAEPADHPSQSALARRSTGCCCR